MNSLPDIVFNYDLPACLLVTMFGLFTILILFLLLLQGSGLQSVGALYIGLDRSCPRIPLHVIHIFQHLLEFSTAVFDEGFIFSIFQPPGLLAYH